MKFKLMHFYECSFNSVKCKRSLYVVADSFGRAAALAHSISDGWEDKDAFELACISLRDIFVVSA